MRGHWVLVVGVGLLVWMGVYVIRNQGQEFRDSVGQRSKEEMEIEEMLPIEGVEEGLLASGEEKRVGGQTDDYGCLTGAGYTWCLPKDRCIRYWEEECYGEVEDAVMVEVARKYAVERDRVWVRIDEKTDEHARGWFEVDLGGYEDERMMLVVKINGRWVLAYASDGTANCRQLMEYRFPDYMLVGLCE